MTKPPPSSAQSAIVFPQHHTATPELMPFSLWNDYAAEMQV